MPVTNATTRLTMGDIGHIIEDWLERHGMANQPYYQDVQSGVVLRDCPGLSVEASRFFESKSGCKESG